MKKVQKILYACENTGIGVFTSICAGFAAFFGCKNKRMNMKMDKVTKSVILQIERQAKSFGADEINELRINTNGTHTQIVAYAVAVKYIETLEKKNEPISKVVPSVSKPVEEKELEKPKEMQKASEQSMSIDKIKERQALLERDVDTLTPNELNECGKFYYNGDGVQRDFDKAFYYFERAAEELPNAKYNLALCYYFGKGNISKAKSMLKELADSGHEKAKEALEALTR